MRAGVFVVLDLHLEFCFDAVCLSASGMERAIHSCLSYMSKGYTMAFARTAPVAPATAFPQGGSRTCFDWPPMVSICMKVRAFRGGQYGMVSEEEEEGGMKEGKRRRHENPLGERVYDRIKMRMVIIAVFTADRGYYYLIFIIFSLTEYDFTYCLVRKG